MKVKKLMKTDVGTCNSGDDLTKAVEIMRSKDCGAVPIVDDGKKLVGIITDRDICLAVSEFDKKPSEIKINEIVKKRIFTCSADDELKKALKKMKRIKVKRLPVVDKNREIVGILSITDFLTSLKKDKSIRKKVYSTLKAIGKPQPIVLREIAEAEM
jgi:CBS domain-containing protein